MQQILKYPRTHHIEGSKEQPGDEDLNCVPFSHLTNKYLVIEEKLDGSNSAVSFNDHGELRLQSRGHFLTGGPRERHFALFKTWGNTHFSALHEVLSNRYIMFGEWLYAKHTIFYTHLPHYFMEFDIYDKVTELFLSTKARKALLEPLSIIQSVPVLFEGQLESIEEMKALVGPSNYIDQNHLAILREKAEKQNLNADKIIFETDNSILMEGLYIKVEQQVEVVERYKYVRGDFLTTVLNSQSHWLDRPIIPNGLKEEVDLFTI
ncbi:MAG: RNA ligase family protein [Bacteroidota bacterium]